MVASTCWTRSTEVGAVGGEGDLGQGVGHGGVGAPGDGHGGFGVAGEGEDDAVGRGGGAVQDLVGDFFGLVREGCTRGNRGEKRGSQEEQPGPQ